MNRTIGKWESLLVTIWKDLEHIIVDSTLLAAENISLLISALEIGRNVRRDKYKINKIARPCGSLVIEVVRNSRSLFVQSARLMQL